MACGFVLESLLCILRIWLVQQGSVRLYSAVTTMERSINLFSLSGIQHQWSLRSASLLKPPLIAMVLFFDVCDIGQRSLEETQGHKWLYGSLQILVGKDLHPNCPIGD